MKGLLVKDFYMLWKQARFMLLLVLIYIAVGAWNPENGFWGAFSVLFMSMLPITALGLDERCKWNQYVMMLPCSRKDIVLEKYILGLLGAIGVVLVYGGLTCILQSLAGNGLSIFQMGQLIIPMLLLACLYLGINMPIMFRYGVEKGRMWFLLMTVVMVAGCMYIMKVSDQKEGFADIIGKIEVKTGALGAGAGLILFVGSVIFLILSMLLSVRIFEKREL